MLQDLRAVFLRDLDATAREVESYPSDQALWSVAPGQGITNSGGVLARHLAGNLRHFIGHVLGGLPYTRNRDDEFANRGLPRAEVAAELRAAHRGVGDALNALPLARLSDAYPLELAGKRFTTLQFLLHLSAHLGYHLGQIDYHRRALSADAKAIGTMGFDQLRAIPAPAGPLPGGAGTASKSAAAAGASSSAAATFASLDDSFARIPTPWSPVVVGELNGQEVKAVKLSGAFDWHAHQHEDELFLVHKGALRMEFRDRAVEVKPGEFIIVPRAVEHRPVAEHGAEVVLFEPVGIVRTGDA
jgi:mannose-6-phosphate isomerase-like protein (cupin superfamily)